MKHPIPLLLLAAALAFGEDWSKKAFPNWTEATTVRLVTDSPWAKNKTVRLTFRKREEQPITYKDVPGADKGNAIPQNVGSPVGGIGVRKDPLPDSADIIIRWASALPVRQAKALYLQRQEKPGTKDLNSRIGSPEADYVLEVYGLPAMVAHQGTGSVESVVRDGSYMKTRSGRMIRPNRVEATLTGMSLTIMIHFPRTAPLTLADQEVEVYGDGQIFEFKEKFRLSPMVYLSHLEL